MARQVRVPTRSSEQETTMLKKAKAQAKAKAKTQSARRTRAHADEAKDFPQNMLDSSRQVLLAGLGALSRARGEGMKVFDSLIEQGQGLEARTRRAASETAAAAAGVASQKAKEMQAMAGGTWDKLEQVFEDRVARALTRLGVYTQKDVVRLAERVEALSRAVNELIKAGAAPAPAKRSAAKPRARRATKTASSKRKPRSASQ
jgi:poly(hydroxyalkanoate) granule-associated protein